ncbi:acyl-CoA dehydrogenase [Alkalilimnicola ehrlichii]|uniref:Acyl-CoA dehydrogenase n=1 Tax=Alkalilimnicola ehrlichii TaxID=351052 RepID=A0A3E0WN24_9GAMM|nr:acyl-CoA dehydrogenase [Alkalilimnicola ehrlichii]RFA27804.1 acyl-CoA dehydrogenase [Alkalilimnicola ehrlichii]RFA33551.1 acyl-CoA dehydrogenase [Alkalilimnicola ehrlichii]
MAGLVLSEEQQMLKDAAQGFLQDHAPVGQLRKLRDERDPLGYVPELWQGMAELGFTGTLVPEAFGGSAFGHVGMGQISEQAGRNLSASPLFATAIVGASAIALGGSESQCEALLPALVDGSLLTALAVDETARHAPTQVRTQATQSGDGYRLSGEKRFVIDGHIANKLIVSARSAGEPGDTQGITLFLLDADAAGVSIERTVMVDSRNAAVVRLDNVQVGAEAVLGDPGAGYDLLQQVLDIGNAQLAAELLGISQEVFERTVQYLKERKQFGVLIGSFQALQHRAAHWFSEIELVKSVVLRALMALDEGAANAAQLVSLAKAKASEVAELSTNEGVQMHGGIGMTDEFDIGLFLKRARPAQQLFGDYGYHANRFALLGGY